MKDSKNLDQKILQTQTLNLYGKFMKKSNWR